MMQNSVNVGTERVKIRVLNITGIYSLINLVSALPKSKNNYKNIIILHVYLIKDNDYNACYNKISPIVKMLCSYEDFYILDLNHKTKEENVQIFNNINNKYPIIDEFFTCHLHVIRYMNNLKDYINYKKLILIDEGWTTYIHCINDKVIFDEVYLINPSMFTKIERKKYNIKQINIKLFKKTIQLLQRNLLPPTIKDDSIVFCSGFIYADRNFHEYQKFLDEEIELIKKLQNHFNCTIYYKKHPRTTYNIESIIREKLNNIEIIDFDYPIEIILHARIKCIVAYYSTVLMTASHIFNIPAYIYKGKIFKSGENQKNKANFYFPDIYDFISHSYNKLSLKSFFYKKYNQANKINKVISILNPNNTENEVDTIIKKLRKKSVIKLLFLQLLNSIHRKKQ